MLDPARDNGELARPQLHLAVAQLDSESAFDHVEKLVLGLVIVPDELTLELDRLDVEVVDLADDLRLPVFAEELELIRHPHLLDHVCSSLGYAINLDGPLTFWLYRATI